MVKQTLDDFIGCVCVSGEIASVTCSALGHWYFTLKDTHSQVSCVCFSGRASGLKDPLKVGMQIKVMAQVGLYAPRGQFQLTVLSIEHDGSGHLHAAFLKLKSELDQEGIFDLNHKKSIPRAPMTIGVVTSPTGAAIADILKVLGLRFPLACVIVYPCLVQGDKAPGQIVHAIEHADRRSECDVLVLARGGGDLSDLMPFNTREVAMAIYRCQIPVVSGIGHEIDETIADYVADKRAPTPSAAAELVSLDQHDLFLLLDERLNRMVLAAKQVVREASQKLQIQRQRLQNPIDHLRTIQLKLQYQTELLARRQQEILRRYTRLLEHYHQCLSRRQPMIEVQRYSHRIALEKSRLQQCMSHFLLINQNQLKMQKARLDGLCPTHILSRGYAVVTSKAGKVVTQASEKILGDTLVVHLHQGRLQAKVEEVECQDEG